MAIIKSAKKEIKASAKRRVFNVRRSRAMKSSIKTLLTNKKESQDVKEAYRKAQQAIDKAEKRGIIKKNTASRKKSRLVKQIKK